MGQKNCRSDFAVNRVVCLREFDALVAITIPAVSSSAIIEHASLSTHRCAWQLTLLLQDTQLR